MSLLFWHRLAGSASLLSYSLNNSFLKSHSLFFCRLTKIWGSWESFQEFHHWEYSPNIYIKNTSCSNMSQNYESQCSAANTSNGRETLQNCWMEGSYVIQILVLLVTLYYRKYSAWWRQRSKHCAKAPRWKPRMMQHSRSRRNNKIKKTQKARRDSNFSTPEREWR